MQGLAMQRILELMAQEHKDTMAMDFDFVLVAGHFLMRDENIFTYFEGQGVKIDHHCAPSQPFEIRESYTP